MSHSFQSIKEKRARPSSKEARSSFVKNVTSRVSGLLPSTITKWFSSPSVSNGSAPTADASDSSEDEALDSPILSHPPSKRMRYSLNETHTSYNSTETSYSTNDVEIIEIPYSSFSGTQFAQPSRNSFTTPLRPPNEEQEKMMTEKDTDHVFKLPHTVTNIGQSIANKRKSIFDTTNKEETERVVAKSSSNTMRDPKQSNFKPRLLGSPFYPGRTMYGGAASSYINQPNIEQQTVAVVNESKNNDDTAISSAARRVMDLLESYSSPLMEARRIPLYTRPKSDGFITPKRYTPYANKSLSYKTQELYVPSVASILQLKKKSRLMDTTNAARQIIASHSSASDFPPYPTAPKGKEPENEQTKMTTKVKSRLSRTNRGIQSDQEMVIPVELPTSTLKLDKDKMPQFSFGIPPASEIPATSTLKAMLPTVDKTYTRASTSKHETVTSSVFEFSIPVLVSSDSSQMDTPTKFIFDNPEYNIDQKFESKHDDSSVFVGVVKEPENPFAKSKDWQCADCWVKNKSEAHKCVCCGAKQPTKNAERGDCQSQKDNRASCEMSQTANPIAAESTGIRQSSKWKCEDCWVSNNDSAVKCICCGGSRQEKLSSTPASATITSAISIVTTATPSAISSKTTPVTSKVDDDWKCDDCWISNKSSVDKCAACGGARPGAKQSNVANVSINRTSFFGHNRSKNIVNTQKSEKWKCSICLVPNDSNISICICCGQDRELIKQMPGIKFNFGKNLNNPFKFGINAKEQGATTANKPEVISTQDKLKLQSETNNNVLDETPLLTLPSPAKKNQIEAPKENLNEAPKMNFSFVIPNPTSAPTSTLNVTKTLDSNKNSREEKLQEVPSVDLNALLQNKSPLAQINNKDSTFTIATSSMNAAQKDNSQNLATLPGASGTDKSKPTFCFGVTTNTSTLAQIKNKDSTFTIATSSMTAAQKDNPLNSATLPGASGTDKPKPTFSFGVTTTKFFDTSASLFTQQSQSNIQSATSTHSSTPSSLFQLPNLTGQSAPVFQNSEKASNVATRSVFSFGNNGQSNSASPTLTAAPETPKFQFTFGATSTPKSDPPALFKSPFSSTESMVNANNFNLSAGTKLGSNNSLSNIQGESNGLPAGNGLTGNAMLGNSLGTLPSANNITIGNTGTLGGNNGLSAIPLSGGNSIQPANPLSGGNCMQPGNPLSMGNNMQSENPLAAGNSMQPTNLLAGGNSMQPTNLLAAGNSMQPTNLLAGGNSMQPTNLLAGGNSMQPTNLLAGGNSMQPTNLLAGGNSMQPGDPLSMGNNMQSENPLSGGHSMQSENPLSGGHSMQSENPLSGGNSMQSVNTLPGNAVGLFNNPVHSENVWSASSAAPTTNPFVSNSATSTLQNSSTFTFGSSTPFNTSNNAPSFGSTVSMSQNIFSPNNQTNNRQPMFANNILNQLAGNVFVSQPAASNSTAQMPMFGSTSLGTPSFEVPSHTPTPAPAFNFGGQQSSSMFGFGQQQLQQQQMQQQHLQQQQLQHQQSPQQTGVYSFGGAPAGAPQVQFSMGSGANPAVRRVRKAVRRNPQR